MKEELDVNTPAYWDSVYEDERNKHLFRADNNRYNIILGHIKEDSCVLDFGCGIGEFLKWLKAKRPNATLVGVDYSPYAIKIAKEECPANSYIVGDTLVGDNYNIIIMSHVIEHLKVPEEYIIEAKKRLIIGGLLIVVLPAHDQKWYEHPKIWTLNDMRDFFKVFNGWNWTMIYRPNTGIKHKDGHPFEESIIFMQKL